MHNDLTKEFVENCWRHNLSITPQRMAIYNELMQSKTHPTVDGIYERVRMQFPNISLDTVYRTLSTFVEIGLTHIVESYGDVKRYDPDTRQHHHFHCTKCNKIVDFASVEYNNLKIPDEILKQFSVAKIKVLLEGQCDECLKKT